MTVVNLGEIISELGKGKGRGRKGRRKEKSKTEADKIFDTLWDTFLEAVEEPVILYRTNESEVIEDLITTIGAEIDYGVYKRLMTELDINLIDWFATYLVKGTLPDETEFDTMFFEKMEYDCTEGNMDSYYECISNAYYYTRAVKMFIKEYLPSVLTVETVG
jgi:hypothetical protein